MFLPSKYRIILKSFPSSCESLSSSGYEKVMSKHSLQKYSLNDTLNIPKYNKRGNQNDSRKTFTLSNLKKKVAESIESVIVIRCNDNLIISIDISYRFGTCIPSVLTCNNNKCISTTCWVCKQSQMSQWYMYRLNIQLKYITS